MQVGGDDLKRSRVATKVYKWEHVQSFIALSTTIIISFEILLNAMNAINGGSSYHNPSQMSLLDIFFPGLSMVSASAQQLFAGNLDSYTRLLCTVGMFVLFTRYAIRYVWELVRSYFSS